MVFCVRMDTYLLSPLFQVAGTPLVVQGRILSEGSTNHLSHSIKQSGDCLDWANIKMRWHSNIDWGAQKGPLIRGSWRKYWGSMIKIKVCINIV